MPWASHSVVLFRDCIFTVSDGTVQAVCNLHTQYCSRILNFNALKYLSFQSQWLEHLNLRNDVLKRMNIRTSGMMY
jgi:hypothetical protein